MQGLTIPVRFGYIFLDRLPFIYERPIMQGYLCAVGGTGDHMRPYGSTQEDEHNGQ